MAFTQNQSQQGQWRGSKAGANSKPAPAKGGFGGGNKKDDDFTPSAASHVLKMVDESGEMKTITGLWIKTDKTGKTYMSGKDRETGVKYIVFEALPPRENDKKDA